MIFSPTNIRSGDKSLFSERHHQAYNCDSRKVFRNKVYYILENNYFYYLPFNKKWSLSKLSYRTLLRSNTENMNLLRPYFRTFWAVFSISCWENTNPVRSSKGLVVWDMFLSILRFYFWIYENVLRDHPSK